MASRTSKGPQAVSGQTPSPACLDWQGAEAGALFPRLIEALPDAVLIVAEGGLIAHANAAAVDLFGYPREALVGSSIDKLVPESLRGAHQGHVAGFSANPRCRAMDRALDVRAVHAGGHEFPIDIMLSPLETPAGVFVIAVIRDISELKQAQEAIEHMAYHDPLTGLPNRRLLADRLSQSIAAVSRYGHSLAIISLDLDDLKVVNDRYGHDAGDVLLVTVAERLRLCVRESDTVARMGGDEFLLLLTEATRDDALAVRGRVDVALSREVPYGSHRLRATASTGFAVFGEDGTDARSLQRAADHRMYLAKRRRARAHISD